LIVDDQDGVARRRQRPDLGFRHLFSLANQFEI
jgi:hypothetical protein